MPTKKKTGRGNKSIATTGRIIIRLAKEYRSKHPQAKWTTAMKEAGKMYRAGNRGKKK